MGCKSWRIIKTGPPDARMLPGRDVNTAYASLKQFFTNAMPFLTGTNKA